MGIAALDLGGLRWWPGVLLVERAVYLCCLESIQNAAKHAGSGATVTVRLSREADELRFSVEDDGCGFDPQIATPGAGLAGLRDRVETVGGRVEVDTEPGRGTTVAGAVPWPARGVTIALGQPGAADSYGRND